jgi:hypothetical protein
MTKETTNMQSLNEVRAMTNEQAYRAWITGEKPLVRTVLSLLVAGQTGQQVIIYIADHERKMGGSGRIALLTTKALIHSVQGR